MTATASATTAPTKSSVQTPPSRLRRALGSRAALPVGLGVVGWLVAFTGSWIPSYWGDEAASVMSAERSVPSLFRMLGNVDAVHGTYYLFLHYWIEVFGASELSTRFPSTVAAGFIVAGTFILGQRLARRSVGITAALVCALLPRIDYLGAETRSYAFSTAIAVWLTIYLLELVRRRSSAVLPWLGYAVAMAAGLYVFLYLGLLMLVHAGYLVTSRQFAPVRRRWLESAIVTVILSLPIIWFGYQERSQIAFLRERDYATVFNLLVMQWTGNVFLAIVVWALVVLAVVSAIRAWRRWRERSELIVLTLLWVILPTTILLFMNIAVPTYNLRYVSFSAPALALLAVAGAYRIRSRWLKVTALGALVVFAIPTDIGQREPFAMDQGSDLAQTAALIGAEAHPGDAVVFDRTSKPSQRLRLALHLYPTDFTGLKDVALKESYLDRAGLWDTTFPLDEVSERLNGVDTVWLLELTGSPDTVHRTDIHTLEDLGYTIQSKHTVNRAIVYKFSEGS